MKKFEIDMMADKLVDAWDEYQKNQGAELDINPKTVAGAMEFLNDKFPECANDSNYTWKNRVEVSTFYVSPQSKATRNWARQAKGRMGLGELLEKVRTVYEMNQTMGEITCFPNKLNGRRAWEYDGYYKMHDIELMAAVFADKCPKYGMKAINELVRLLNEAGAELNFEKFTLKGEADKVDKEARRMEKIKSEIGKELKAKDFSHTERYKIANKHGVSVQMVHDINRQIKSGSLEKAATEEAKKAEGRKKTEKKKMASIKSKKSRFVLNRGLVTNLVRARAEEGRGFDVEEVEAMDDLINGSPAMYRLINEMLDLTRR